MPQGIYLVQSVEGTQPNTALVVFHKATHIIAGDTEFLLDGKLLADSVLYLVHAVAEGGHPHRSTAVPV